MADEQQVDAQAEQAANDKAADDAFRSGFADISGEQTPVEDKPAPAPVKEPIEPIDPAEADAALAEPQVLPGYTPEQVTQLLARVAEFDRFQAQLDKVNGHIGRVIQDVKTMKAAPEVPKVDPEKFAEDYGDIATFTKQEVSAVQEKVNALEALLQQQTAQMQAWREEDKLAIQHPDWQKTVVSDDYKLWLSLQAKETQELANTTADASELAKVVTSYKDFSKKATKQAKNEERLTAALTPTGQAPVRPAEPTEQDAFMSGWRSVAGTRQ